MELEAKFNFAQNYQFKRLVRKIGRYTLDFENKVFELPLKTRKYQIISSENEVQNYDNQQFSLEIETYSQDVLSEDESNKSLLQLYLGFKFTTWEDVDRFIELYGKCK
ncbi:23541_t:CDS:2, partial [Dentiscutata erythropus]